MKLPSEILSKAADRLLTRLDNMTDEELISALKACEDRSLSYALYGDIPSSSEYTFEKYEYHLSMTNFTISCENAFYNMHQKSITNSRHLELSEASNDDAYELAA